MSSGEPHRVDDGSSEAELTKSIAAFSVKVNRLKGLATFTKDSVAKVTSHKTALTRQEALTQKQQEKRRAAALSAAAPGRGSQHLVLKAPKGKEGRIFHQSLGEHASLQRVSATTDLANVDFSKPYLVLETNFVRVAQDSPVRLLLLVLKASAHTKPAWEQTGRVPQALKDGAVLRDQLLQFAPPKEELVAEDVRGLSSVMLTVRLRN